MEAVLKLKKGLKFAVLDDNNVLALSLLFGDDLDLRVLYIPVDIHLELVFDVEALAANVISQV